MTPELDVPATLQRAGAGDAQAWADLLDAYGRRVFGLLFKQCGDRELAEELAQQTFVKLVEVLRKNQQDEQDHQDDAGDTAPPGHARYQERGRFEAWLFRIAMNRLRDEMRRRKRHATPTDMTAAAASGSAERDAGWATQQTRVVSGVSNLGPGPLENLERAEQVDQLRRCIAELPEADRELLHLRHTAGLSFAQIAETLDQPLGTVLARGHRALKKLRTMMEQPAA